MGIPSIGIYAHELFAFYGVETIIRIGSAGAFTEEINVYDTILATSAYSDSSFAKCKLNDDSSVQYPDAELNEKLKEAADKLGIKLIEGPIWSSDVFYYDESVMPYVLKTAADNHLLAAEMESFGLFATAKALGKKAACLVTVSDNLVTHVETTSQERQTRLVDMIKIALEAIEE